MLFDNFFSLITLGDSGVGKTSLIQRFTDKKYNENAITTIGFGSSTKDIVLKNGKKNKIKIN